MRRAGAARAPAGAGGADRGAEPDGAARGAGRGLDPRRQPLGRAGLHTAHGRGSEGKGLRAGVARPPGAIQMSVSGFRPWDWNR